MAKGLDWTTGTVDNGGIKLHFYRTGGAKPPLLLAHGFSDNGLCWTRLAQSLEGEYDVIMVDARGHGLSDAPESGYSDEDQAADLAAVIEALALARPALLGHSMGAAVAAAAAANYPHLVRCVLLEDPPWPAAADKLPAEERMARAAAWEERSAKIQLQSVGEVAAGGRTNFPGWDESEWLPWAESKKQYSRSIRARFAADREPWQETVSRITCPILLLVADPERGALVSAEVAAQAAGLWRQGRVVHCSGAGHNIRRERFDCFREAVRSFLKDNMGPA